MVKFVLINVILVFVCSRLLKKEIKENSFVCEKVVQLVDRFFLIVICGKKELLNPRTFRKVTEVLLLNDCNIFYTSNFGKINFFLFENNLSIILMSMLKKKN